MEREGNETYFSSAFINLAQSSAALVRHVSSSISTSLTTATDSVTSLFRKKVENKGCVPTTESKLVKEFVDDLAKRYRSDRRVRLLHKRFDERNITYEGEMEEGEASITCVLEETSGVEPRREVYRIRVSTSSKTHLKDQMMVCLGHMTLDEIEVCGMKVKEELQENIAFLSDEWDEFEEAIVLRGPLWME